MEDRKVEILMVEDNLADAELTRISMREAKILNYSRLHHVVDGEEALEFLRKRGAHAKAPDPDLILLDLNLPRKSGSQVLEEIKADPELRDIPVVVLTSSESEEDIARSYRLHANAYVQKPVGLAQFTKVVAAIETFWFQVVRLPRRGQAPT